MIASAKAVDAWDFTRMIPCHGEVLETNGKVRRSLSDLAHSLRKPGDQHTASSWPHEPSGYVTSCIVNRVQDVYGS